jgi:transcriptional regulator with XRE-family HTH domain
VRRNGREPLPVLLRRLRAERELSRSQLSRQTVEIDGRGLPEITIKDLETNPRQPRIETVELLAAALDVPPETFPEYRLALAPTRIR